MLETQENKEKAIQYLFGELGESERDLLEECLFNDEDLSFFIDSLEKDLIDDYIRGEMDIALQQRFEKKFLTLESRRLKVETAKILQEKLFAEKTKEIVESENSKVTFWQSLAEIFRQPNFAIAGSLTVLLLFALIGGWLLLRESSNEDILVKDNNINVTTPVQTPDNSPINQSSPPTNQNEVNNTPINLTHKNTKPEKTDKTSPPAQPQPKIFAFSLFPVVRSGERPTINVPNSAESANLQIIHDNQKEFVKYRLELRNENGSLISQKEIPLNKKNLARPVNLLIKNSLLKSGVYELTLRGITQDGNPEELKFYNFKIKKN